MNKIFLLLFLIILSYSQNLEITSNHFEYNQSSNISIFSGDVNATKGSDNILSDTITLYLTKDKKLDKLIADGNVSFKVKDNNSTYIGKSGKLTYIAPKELFIFEQNVHIQKIEDKQELFGEKVIINKKDGTARVIGKKHQPLKFIIKVNSEN